MKACNQFTCQFSPGSLTLSTMRISATTRCKQRVKRVRAWQRLSPRQFAMHTKKWEAICIKNDTCSLTPRSNCMYPSQHIGSHTLSQPSLKPWQHASNHSTLTNTKTFNIKKLYDSLRVTSWHWPVANHTASFEGPLQSSWARAHKFTHARWAFYLSVFRHQTPQIFHIGKKTVNISENSLANKARRHDAPVTHVQNVDSGNGSGSLYWWWWWWWCWCYWTWRLFCGWTIFCFSFIWFLGQWLDILYSLQERGQGGGKEQRLLTRDLQLLLAQWNIKPKQCILARVATKTLGKFSLQPITGAVFHHRHAKALDPVQVHWQQRHIVKLQDALFRDAPVS